MVRTGRVVDPRIGRLCLRPRARASLDRLARDPALPPPDAAIAALLVLVAPPLPLASRSLNGGLDYPTLLVLGQVFMLGTHSVFYRRVPLRRALLGLGLVGARLLEQPPLRRVPGAIRVARAPTRPGLAARGRLVRGGCASREPPNSAIRGRLLSVHPFHRPCGREHPRRSGSRARGDGVRHARPRSARRSGVRMAPIEHAGRICIAAPPRHCRRALLGPCRTPVAPGARRRSRLGSRHPVDRAGQQPGRGDRGPAGRGRQPVPPPALRGATRLRRHRARVAVAPPPLHRGHRGRRADRHPWLAQLDAWAGRHPIRPMAVEPDHARARAPGSLA